MLALVEENLHPAGPETLDVVAYPVSETAHTDNGVISTRGKRLA